MARERYGPRCVIKNKSSFGSYNFALREARRHRKDQKPYSCPVCGWYHLSEMTQAEADRRFARRNWQQWQQRQERDGRFQLPRAG